VHFAGVIMRRLASTLFATSLLLIGCSPSAGGRDCSIDPLRSECFTSPPAEASGGKADAVVGSNSLWPGADLYLVEDELGFLSRTVLTRLQQSFAEQTPIRVHILAHASDAPSTHVVDLHDRWPGEGGVSYGIGADTEKAESSPESIAHELGHVLGLYHTQSRVDRDEKVLIHWPYISELYKTQMQMVDATTAHIGPYDTSSIMQYGSQPLGHDWCVAMTRRTTTNQDPNRCVGPFAGVTDLVRDENIDLDYNHWYSELDYARLSVLYCDPRYCADRCASSERCASPTVAAHRELIYAWERSADGAAWRARYPGAAR